MGKNKKLKKGVMKVFEDGQGPSDPKVMALKMVTEIFDYEEIKTSDTYIVKHYKDSFYSGQGDIEAREREGLGICSYYNGRHYEGGWQNDKRHGRGYERFSNGNTYLGEYEKGKVRGKGLYTWVNGDTYDGDWKDGQK